MSVVPFPKQSLSVVIITLNAAVQLADCLESVSFADEILVVDSGSQDATTQIATRFGARVIPQVWLGFGRQKNFAVTLAENDWVLCLDADERVSPELRTSIIQLLASVPACQVYEMARCNRFMQRWLRHGEGYPDWSLRLFNRNAAQWNDDAIHEKVVSGSGVGRLRGDLLHESAQDLASYLDKQNKYTTLQAKKLFAAGKSAGYATLLLSPLLRFVKFYFLRLGFMDGVPGLIHIAIGCYNSFMKYAKLMEMCQEQKSK